MQQRCSVQSTRPKGDAMQQYLVVAVVYLYPAGNAVASTSGTIPPFHHLCEGALPWYHTSFSTS
jgi:hypothetical protein